jgi:hypothetical protein
MTPEELKNILTDLIKYGILPKTLSTRRVVEFLDNSEYHRKKLYQPEFKEVLGRSRKKEGGNFQFDTIKVIEFKLETQGTIRFPQV